MAGREDDEHEVHVEPAEVAGHPTKHLGSRKMFSMSKRCVQVVGGRAEEDDEAEEAREELYATVSRLCFLCALRESTKMPSAMWPISSRMLNLRPSRERPTP